MKIGATSPELLQEMLDWFRLQKSMTTTSSQAIYEPGITFENNTGFEIPAYGVFQGHTSVNLAYRSARVAAKRPIDANAHASAVFVNGPRRVPNKQTGTAQVGPLYRVLTDGSATAGAELGLEANQFRAKPGSGPFVAIGADDVADDVFLCVLASKSTGLRLFKTPSGGIPAAGTGGVPGPGEATCTEYPAGMTGPAGATAVVKNHRLSIVPGTVFILVDSFGADLYCVEGNCPSTFQEPTEGGGGPE